MSPCSPLLRRLALLLAARRLLKPRLNRRRKLRLLTARWPRPLTRPLRLLTPLPLRLLTRLLRRLRKPSLQSELNGPLERAARLLLCTALLSRSQSAFTVAARRDSFAPGREVILMTKMKLGLVAAVIGAAFAMSACTPKEPAADTAATTEPAADAAAPAADSAMAPAADSAAAPAADSAAAPAP